MKILISGAGIAGPTLAYWLTQYGFEITIVERAPKLRTGGYIIDFWGAGLEIANRMGLLAEIRGNGYAVQEVRVVDENGKRISGFPANAFARATSGGVTSLRRGDLAATIFNAIRDRVEVLFDDTVDSVEQTETNVNVAFERQPARSFDLVIGADGLHSRIRQLVFGAAPRFERYLGIKVAAFDVEGYRPRDELVYIMYTTVGQQVSRFAMRHDRTMFLFTFLDDDPALPPDIRDQKQVLRKRFGQSGWECPQILNALDSVNDLYFDRVSQVYMDPDEGFVDAGPDRSGRRRCVLHLTARWAGFAISDGCSLYPGWRASAREGQLPRSLRAISGVARRVSANEAARGAAFCWRVRAWLYAGAVPPKQGVSAAIRPRDCKSHGARRLPRQYRTSRVLTRTQASQPS